MSEFADDVGRALAVMIQGKVVDQTPGKQNQLEVRKNNSAPPDPSDLEECFLCIRHGVFGRIRKQVESGRQASGLYFEPLDHEQAVTELERWIDFVKLERSGEHSASMAPATAKTLIAADMFRRYLPTVDRIFDYALPVGMRGGSVPSDSELPGTLECEQGIDAKDDPGQASPIAVQNTGSSSPLPKANKSKPKFTLVNMRPGFGNYRQRNGERVFYYCDAHLKHYISLNDAKDVIAGLFSEFAFVDEQSRCHAIARLLTPYCQALMGWRKRGPLWVFTANRPRAGKDYLAMLAPLVHAYYPVQDPPLEDDEEVKRRITAALMAGRRFMHFANCRRDLDNPSLEAAVTTEYWTDRIIRSSAEATVPNEMIFSLSYNHSWSIKPDLIARMRAIRLENRKVDPNARKFKVKQLHDLVTIFDPPRSAPGRTENTKICRRNILAALNALTRHWAAHFEEGSRGRGLASFPEWSAVVGGIMRATGLGNPCEPDRHLAVQGYDDQAKDLLALAEHISKSFPQKQFQTGEITSQFIVPDRNRFVDFGARLLRLGDEKRFNKEFGQILSENADHPLMGEDGVYTVQKVKHLTPNHFVFVRKPYADCEETDPVDAFVADDYLI